MKYLRSIIENNTFEDNIGLISDIEDIFIFLDDDWGLGVDCWIHEIEENLTLGYRISRKYNKRGVLFYQKNSNISNFGSGSRKELHWFVESKGKIEINDSIMNLYSEVDDSIERCCKTLGFDGLSTRSSMEIWSGKSPVNRIETFFFGDVINSGESEISRLEDHIKTIYTTSPSKVFGGVKISTCFRK